MSYLSGLISDWEAIADEQDSHTNSLDMTETGTLVYGANGVLIQAADSGTNYLTRADSDLFDINQNFFGMAEILFTEENGATGQVIFQHSAIGGGTSGWGVSYSNNNDYVLFYSYLSSSGYTYVTAATPGDPTLARHFVFFWADVDAETINIQVDNGSPVSVSTAGETHVNYAGLFSLGNNVSGTQPVGGYVRRARLWRGTCVLDNIADKITWLYNSGNGRTYANLLALGHPNCSEGGGGGGSAACGAVRGPQLWMLTTSRLVGRWQASATRDMEIGTDTSTGTAIPDWVYSTGYAPTETPARVDGLMVDATKPVTVQVSKTAIANEPEEARTVDIVPKDGQDEVFVPGIGDLRGHKFRLEFRGQNRARVRRAMWDRSAISGGRGG